MQNVDVGLFFYCTCSWLAAAYFIQSDCQALQ